MQTLADIPSVRLSLRSPIALLTFLRSMRADTLGMVNQAFEDLGETWCIQLGGGQQVMFSNPDHIHEILVKQAGKLHKDADYTDPKAGLARFVGTGLLTSDGEFWKRQRKLAAPALHTKRIEAYADTMVAYSLRMLEAWADGEQRDIAHEMMTLTLAIVAKTLFNADVQGDSERFAEAMKVIQEFNGSFSLLPDWLPTPTRLRVNRVSRELDEIVYRLIRERRANPADQGDLLSMLLLAVDEDGSGMTDKQVRDEMLTLFLAGHETTANTMNWTWMLLAQYPEVEAKLHEELDRVLAGDVPTLADLKRLPYTEMVIKESLRLYPPAWGIGRVTMEDVEIGGISLPKGTVIGASFHRVHHDPRWWDAPEVFQPERFSAENEPNIPKYAYVPFGGGPRVCIGASFAMMEACLLLATIAARYQLRMLPGHKVHPEARITLYPRDGLPMRLIQRETIPVDVRESAELFVEA